MKLWKCLLGGNRSSYGRIVWKIGKWKKHEGKLVLCRSGFHASPTIQQAIGFIVPGIVANVEVRGERLTSDDKSVHREMRVLRVWPWTKDLSVRLAVYSAELVLQNHESEYPDDSRPRAAIAAPTAWFSG